MKMFGKTKPKMSGEVCTNCGMTLIEGCDFCPKCGKLKLPEEKNTCPVCGFALRKDQVFCPKCGRRLEAETSVHGAADEAGRSAEKKAKAKKRGMRILAAVVAGVLLLGIGGYFGYAALEKQGQNVVELVRAGDCPGVIHAYESLNSVSKKLCRRDMIAAFIELVKANYYLPEETIDYLISPIVMEQYAEYQQLAQMLDITALDGTNVAEYIDAVLELQPYLKYNEIYACVCHTKNLYEAGNNVIKRDNWEGVVDLFYTAVGYIREYDIKEYLVSDYQNAMNDAYIVADDCKCDIIWDDNYDKILYKIFYADDDAYAAANNIIIGVLNEVSDAEDEVAAICAALPVLQ